MTHPNAAAAFNAAAQEILRARDQKATMTAVGLVLGLPRNVWQRWVSGNRAPSTDTVQGWVKRWTEAGYPAIVLETRKGNFDLAMALGVILMSLSFLANVIMLRLQGRTFEP